MKMRTLTITIFTVIVAIIALALIFSAGKVAVLSDIQIQKPSIVVHGENLASVEIWGIPTGNGITENYLIANVTLQSTDAKGVQTWTAQIPKDPLLVTEIFARAYDRKKGLIGNLSLPYLGAAALHDALWGANATSTEPQPPLGGTTAGTSTNMTLTAGDTETFQNMSVTFNSFVQDSRCPIDVQCFWAGNVTVNVTIKSNGEQITRGLTSDVAPFQFGGYAISIVDIQPPKESKLQIPKNAYQITFHVESV
jgi:hypothetical protein